MAACALKGWSGGAIGAAAETHTQLTHQRTALAYSWTDTPRAAPMVEAATILSGCVVWAGRGKMWCVCARLLHAALECGLPTNTPQSKHLAGKWFYWPTYTLGPTGRTTGRGRGRVRAGLAGCARPVGLWDCGAEDRPHVRHGMGSPPPSPREQYTDPLSEDGGTGAGVGPAPFRIAPLFAQAVRISVAGLRPGPFVSAGELRPVALGEPTGDAYDDASTSGGRFALECRVPQCVMFRLRTTRARSRAVFSELYCLGKTNKIEK